MNIEQIKMDETLLNLFILSRTVSAYPSWNQQKYHVSKYAYRADKMILFTK